MATREYQFITGIETSASPDPATPSADADIVNKGYGDDTYAKLSSWYDKQANITDIKGIASADRSDGQLVYNYGTDVFYRFNSASSATGDDDLVLTPTSGTGRWIKITSSSSAGGGDTIVQQLDTSVAGITCGEAIANRDACVLILHNGTGSDVYRVFKSDADFGNKNSFSGFAKAAGTVTPQISTYTISAAYVSGNVVPITINTRNYSTTYASSSDATLQALSTLIATDQDVTSAVVTVVGGNQTGTDDRVITITSKGGLTLALSGTTVTSGASQPTVTLATSQAASGDTLDLHQYGPLSGFTGLTTGARYFLSATAGSITTSYTSPADVYVGQALSSTILFVNPNNFHYAFQDGTGTLLKGGGLSGATGGNNALDAWEHFNFASWSAGTSQPASRGSGINSDSGLKGNVYNIDGITGTITGGAAAAAAETYEYNKTSWANRSDRTTAKIGSSCASMSGSLFVMRGATNQNNTSGTNTLDSFNGSTWTNAINTFVAAASKGSGFYYSSKVFCTGGYNTSGSPTSATESWNGTTIGAETALPATTPESCAGIGMLSFAYVVNYLATTSSYKYSGTTWSSNYSVGAGIVYGSNETFTGPSGGFNASTGRAYMTCGSSQATGAAIATTYQFDGTTVTASTSASTVLTAPSGGMA